MVCEPCRGVVARKNLNYNAGPTIILAELPHFCPIWDKIGINLWTLQPGCAYALPLAGINLSEPRFARARTTKRLNPLLALEKDDRER